jgi:DNA integrity scanning protein DisA with diadenylate cyclase activity
MSIRKVKQYSDRGNIKDLNDKHESEVPLLPTELRLKKLYDYAKLHHDNGILNILGFITTEYIDDKNALPLTAYRIRKIIADISSRSGEQIQQLKNEIDNCFEPALSKSALEYIGKKQLIKNAATRQPPVFRRVS